MKTITLLIALSVGPVLSAPTEQDRSLGDPDLDPNRCPMMCSGTDYDASQTSLYVCGDPRLGPAKVPFLFDYPLETLWGAWSNYHRFGGLCPGEFLRRYYNSPTNSSKSGSWIYPTFAGYLLDTTGDPVTAEITLERGTLLDRFGSEYGTYMSPAGTPYMQRSLPPTNLNAPPDTMYPSNYRVYEVAEPVPGVMAGPIAPWFGQMGLGLQFRVPGSVADMVNQGFLVRLNLTADPDW